MASKKLYIELASTIKRHVDHSDEVGVFTIQALVQDLCGDLKQDNIHFNKDRFLAACGL